MTINNAKYYESNTATAIDAQFDLTHNPEKVTHTSNMNETVTHISNGIFEQKFLINQTIPVLTPSINQGIYQGIALIILAPHTLLKLVMKKVVADAASGGTWVNRTIRQVRRAGFNGSTPGHITNTGSISEPPYPVLIGIVSSSPPCGVDDIQKVANKWLATSLGLVVQTKKLDTVVEKNLPNDLDYTSIFSKSIGHKLSDGSSSVFYLRYRMNFAADPVQICTPQFIDLGVLYH